jgi:phage terminase large subunit-like protein
VPTISERVAGLRALVRADPALADDKDFARELAALDELLEGNPLQAFEPHVAQAPFFEARTPVVAAFAGNRFGKTTALAVRLLIECCDRECLPPWLLPFKRWDADTAPRGTQCRIVNPSFQLLESVILPAFRQWCPPAQLRGGSFDKAIKGAPDRRLDFKNGSSIQFMTYEQDLAKFGGWKGHVVGFDEPPPLEIREECLGRLVDFGGYELFAMTPLKANTGWIRREIFKKREHPDITVIKGSIHDNPTLDEAAKERFLGALSSDLWRRAREFGDFVDVGGLIYTDFERRVVPAPSGETVRGLDVVVSIDPGIRNAGLVFGGFDSDNTLSVFDELLIQDGTPDDYAKQIAGVLKQWGVGQAKVSFVIDPAARARAAVNAETVEGALARLGIYCEHGQNNVEAGIQQIRSRIQHKRIWISEDCRGLRDEADEYAAEDRADGEFKPIKQNDHRLDALRYLAMYRPYDHVAELEAPARNLGWDPALNMAPPAEWLRREPEAPPMGAMS